MYPRPGVAPKSQIIASESAISDTVSGGDADNIRLPKILLIGASPLLTGCLVPTLSERVHFDIVASPTLSNELLARDSSSIDLIILFGHGKEPRHCISAAKEVIDQIAQPPPFAVLADSEDPDEVLAAFELGARAYIPTSITLEVMIEAIKLVVAGGTYFPPCVLSVCANSVEAKHLAHALTPREMAVLEAVRHGLPNKVIAQELGISESTIKVHVHRVLKKLNVQNRTQAALCMAMTDTQ